MARAISGLGPKLGLHIAASQEERSRTDLAFAGERPAGGDRAETNHSGARRVILGWLLGLARRVCLVFDFRRSLS